MYTGLAQPEVKIKGLSWKNSTAFPSSSILAVVSATNALSAKCMSGANFNRLESVVLALQGGSCMVRQLTMVAATALILAPLAAPSQSTPGQLTYRCVGKDGKKYYGSTVPTPCLGQPIEQPKTSGMVGKRINPAGDEKKRQ